VLLAFSTAASAAPTCSASSTGLAFGAWSPAAPPATGTIVITCRGGITIPYSIALSSGSGTFAQRRMTSGTSSLNYNLYTNVAHTIIWGDGSAGSSVVSGSLSAPGTATTTTTVYGRYAPTPTPAPGAYGDTIIVTLTY
jgi:spore coat protein U-like protein